MTVGRGASGPVQHLICCRLPTVGFEATFPAPYAAPRTCCAGTQCQNGLEPALRRVILRRQQRAPISDVRGYPWAIRFLLDHHRRVRDHALFDFAIDSKLSGCDVVKIKIGDIVAGGEIRTRALLQEKTGRPVQFELTAETRASLRAWLERRGGTIDDHVFPSRVDHSDHLSTRQYARLVDEWVTGTGLRKEDCGTHSLRRTKASIIYKVTGNLRAVQILLGHTKIENTVRYLGVDIEDALTLAEGTEI